jgi:hypothetical protein
MMKGAQIQIPPAFKTATEAEAAVCRKAADCK